jgi:hypothetical protein
MSAPVRCYFAAVYAPDWLALRAADWDAIAECGIKGVDVRISQPRAGANLAERDLAARVRLAGLDVRVHGWVGHVGVNGNSIAGGHSGRVCGEWMGQAGASLRASMVGMNAEKDVWRGNDRRANPTALDFYRGFHEGSLRVYPTGLLQDVGFADPREHYLEADQNEDGHPDNLIPRSVSELFDRKGVMAYQSNAETLKRKLARGREIAGPNVPLTWWGSVGRVDKDHGVVGSYEATLRGCRERWSGIDEWIGYVGFGAIKQLVEGHATHPPLVDLVRAINGKVV